MKQQPQGRRLIALLKRRGMTNMQMLMTGISCAPWLRIKEQLRDGETLIKTKNSAGLLVYRVRG